nr:hypothetical protein [Streptomyces murinus]
MRKSLVMAAVVLIAATGCGGGTGDTTGAASPTDKADTRAPVAHHLTVTSPAYRDGGTVPRRFTCDGADISPPIDLSGVPAGTRSLAVTVRDLDAPGGTFTHWLIRDIARPPAGCPPGRTRGAPSRAATASGGPATAAPARRTATTRTATSSRSTPPTAAHSSPPARLPERPPTRPPRTCGAPCPATPSPPAP